ncbi:MAG TPA: DUF4097 family beta strand repeat-containing protein [Gammaproteobacteria bacterium]|nr:DUF4097 family beta strand repeat-containing protein [Gammaproteobacteria bacterium]
MGIINSKAIARLLALALLLGAGPALAARHVETVEHRFAANEFRELELLNLAGEVRVTAGKELLIRASIHGQGDDDAKARANAALVKPELKRGGGKLEVITQFPVQDYDEFVYVRKGGGSGWFGFGSRTVTNYLGERVSVRASGRGLAVHADYEITVPAGMTVKIVNRVGDVVAENVEGDLTLDTASGDVGVRGGKGDVHADTGSGAVTVRDRTGNVSADTGSGSVSVSGVRGKVVADTGSGSVTLRDIVGDVEADTGSGSVTLEKITGSIEADTGSGSVQGKELSAVRRLHVDTGSGSVRMEGDLGALEDLDIDTGSGGVTLLTTAALNMRLKASAGSGGVRIDLPEMKDVRSSRNEFEATVGNGKGRGVIDTGSGGIRISQQ